MKRDASVSLGDIANCIEKIEKYVNGVSKTKFLKDTLIQDAVLRRLEIIGEAVKNIPDEFRKKYPDIRWAHIAGLRDVLIHAYFGVNLERVWLVIEKDLPELKAGISRILKAIEKGNE